MKNFKFKKLNFSKIYLFTLGICIISLYLFLRLFLTRYSYTLDELRESHTNYQVIISLIFIAFHLIILLRILKHFFITVNTQSFFFKCSQYVQKLLNKFFWEPLQYVHDIIAPDIPYSGIIMLKWNDHVAYQIATTNSVKRYYFFSFLVYFVPKILIMLIFLIELYFFNQLKYFLHCLPILIIPVLYKVFLILCESFSERCLPEVEDDLEVTPYGPPAANNRQATFNFRLKTEVFNQYGKDFDYDAYFIEMRGYWLRFYQLKHITDSLKSFINSWEPYISFLSSMIYLIIGIYKFWYILN